MKVFRQISREHVLFVELDGIDYIIRLATGNLLYNGME